MESIHAVMQDANDGNAVSRDAKVNHVSVNTPATIARPDVVAGRYSLGGLRQLGKGRYQGVDVAIGLFYTPLLAGVSPDAFKVALGGGDKAVFSHAGVAFSA